jgi:hypothetical protein
LCRFSRGPGLVRRTRHTGFHLVVRCAIDISSPNELNWFILPLSQARFFCITVLDSPMPLIW